tara:strand:+ start:687 stop:1136 length:450 start_codon:yes stop_codon:yes gene_type:complete
VSKDFDSDLVRKLANLLHETGLEELEYATNEWKIRVARPSSVAVTSGQAPRPLPDPITPNDFSNEDKTSYNDPNILKSPMVGTAYLTPDPDSPPFVDIGDHVKKGDTVMIIEAMKVMNPISAHKSGRLKEVLVNGHEPVEFEQSLMVIE